MTEDQIFWYYLIGFIYSVVFIISMIAIANSLIGIRKTLENIFGEQGEQNEILKDIRKLHEKNKL